MSRNVRQGQSLEQTCIEAIRFGVEWSRFAKASMSMALIRGGTAYHCEAKHRRRFAEHGKGYESMG